VYVKLFLSMIVEYAAMLSFRYSCMQGIETTADITILNIRFNAACGVIGLAVGYCARATYG
jgi:hypothetical protein